MTTETDKRPERVTQLLTAVRDEIDAAIESIKQGDFAAALQHIGDVDEYVAGARNTLAKLSQQ